MYLYVYECRLPVKIMQGIRHGGFFLRGCPIMAAKRSRYKRQSKKTIAAIIVMGAFICAFMLVGIKQLRAKDAEYAAAEAQLEEQISEAEAESEALEEEKIYVQTKQYVEEAAREKLGLVNEDEVILKPSDD